jgi:hypothetical protein
MRRARPTTGLPSCVADVVGGTAGAQSRGAPAGTFGRGTRGPGGRVWLPGRLAPERPLIVALHGRWQTLEDFALCTRLNEAAEARGQSSLSRADTRGEPVLPLELVDPTEQTTAGRETRRSSPSRVGCKPSVGCASPASSSSASRPALDGRTLRVWRPTSWPARARWRAGCTAAPRLGGGDPVHAWVRRRPRGEGLRMARGAGPSLRVSLCRDRR